MKRIKQRLLSLVMTGALLLGFTLPETFAASARSTNESSASEAQAPAPGKTGSKQSKKQTADTQSEKKSSKTKDKTGDKADSGEDKAKSSQSEKSEEKADSSKSEKSEEKKNSSKSKASEKKEKASNTKVSLSLSISKPGGLSASGGVWQVDPDKVSALTLSWKCKGDCDSFEISVSGGVYSASTGKKSAKISVSGLPAGKYTATVKAIRDGKAVARKKLSFQILAPSASQAPEEPEAESNGNDSADDSSIQLAQPEEGNPAEGEGAVEAQPDSSEAESDTEAETAQEEAQDASEDGSADETQEATEEQSTEEAQDPSIDEPTDKTQEATEEQSTEEARDTSEDESTEEAQDTSEDESTVEAQDASEEQPTEEAQDASEGESTVEAQDASEEQPTEEAQDASEEQPMEEAQDTSEDESSDEAQDAPEEQPSEQTQDAPLDQPADEGQAITEEGPDGAANDAIGEAVVEDENDAPMELPVEAENLDLSEPEIQTPLEEPVEIQAVVEEPLPEFTVDALDAPETAPAEADEALELGEPSGEAVLQAGEGDFISANARDDKEKTDDKITLSILGAEGLSVIDGAVHVNPAQASAVNLFWSFGGNPDEYAISVSGGVYDATTGKSRLKLPVKGLPSGQYTVTVAAMKDGKALCSAALSFTVDAADGEGERAGLAITVASPQGLLITEGVYQVDPAQAEALTLAWQFGGECDAYDVSVSSGVYSGQTEQSAVTVPLSGLAAGTYTVTVIALRKGEAVAQAQLSFNIPSQDEKSEDDPGKDGQQGDRPQCGGQRGGGQKGDASNNGEGQEADQGFHVTPGEALISTHTSGNRDMRLYGAVSLTLDGESAMNVLTLGGTPLDIRLSDDSLFTASIDGSTLALAPESKAQAWLLNGYALKTLARSGVTCLRLTLEGVTAEFPTLPELSGSIYGALCAAGVTSRDYSYAVSSSGCSVTVAGQTFQLTAGGELVPEVEPA